MYTSPPAGLSLNSIFDYVIVGGGPAGFVLAEQLSQIPKVSVILLEAGLDASQNDNITIPGFAGVNEFSPRIWDYYTIPQKQLNEATPHLAQGKVWGGGTSVNYMNYNRGSKSVFDEWAEISGIPGLAWDSLINNFKATTRLEPNRRMSNFSQVLDIEAYGNGPVSLTHAQTLDGFDPYWNYALKDTLRLPEVDFNSGAGVGVSYSVESIIPQKRTRETAHTAFGYRMANRRNVRMIHGAYVNKINFAGKRAQSITYADTNNGNRTQTIKAREIIVSAGAIASPKLLMLSGVGPRSHLQQHKIPIILANDHIGANLQDHNYASIEIQVRDPVYTLSQWENSTYLKSIIRSFKQNAAGPLANVPASSFSLVRVPNSALPKGPAGDFHRSLPADRGNLQMQYANVALIANTSVPTTKVITIWVALVQPEAAGTIRLKSSNFWDFPLIDTAYFGTTGDRAVILWGYKALRRVLASDWLKPLIVKEIYPGSNVTSDEGLMQAIRGGAQSYHHPMGTVALGKVLDQDFRVKGLKGLRVVDASVFPKPPNCHPQADVYAVSHLAARLIREADGWD
ncbi:GMC oxidoreductase [Zasmidium cellare ATCC 36951]|uniref:GMC oxidoreductase n=1 Tax=Zasmidium cellare ATCC 36951 TaxID=1080233 RepID=A0A6A6CPB0_ZASCE|nr:GMC oxidoreductase [Zasmidium cellare ATCC 36951]KAF2167950.1 GMC oxidoreductase [Zasmidium cellare ATCC 36951]